MPNELSGKVIVLTGGGDGIGRECATAYVREGAAVAVLDREGERAVEVVRQLDRRQLTGASPTIRDGFRIESPGLNGRMLPEVHRPR